MLLYPHFHKFNFNISFLLILCIYVFVIGVLYISYAILYPLLRKKRKKKIANRACTVTEVGPQRAVDELLYNGLFPWGTTFPGSPWVPRNFPPTKFSTNCVAVNLDR